MFRTDFIRKIIPLQRICIRNKSEPAINIEKLEQDTSTLDVIDEDVQSREHEIQRKRNKSRLKPQHRNVLNEQAPYSEPTMWFHGTLRYSRKMYGRYGEASGVNPSLCWPTKQELADKLEYERVAYPFTIPQMVEDARQKREEKEKRIYERQADIVKKMQKLEHWKQELKNKVAKKESEALAAKERKERLVEEVRRHFGYTVDPRDEKFKEMLEKKEKEQKKAMKIARKKAKEERMLASLISKKDEDTESEIQSSENTSQTTNTDTKTKE